jgi:hypothetical protein
MNFKSRLALARDTALRTNPLGFHLTLCWHLPWLLQFQFKEPGGCSPIWCKAGLALPFGPLAIPHTTVCRDSWSEFKERGKPCRQQWRLISLSHYYSLHWTTGDHWEKEEHAEWAKLANPMPATKPPSTAQEQIETDRIDDDGMNGHI